MGDNIGEGLGIDDSGGGAFKRRQRAQRRRSSRIPAEEGVGFLGEQIIVAQKERKKKIPLKENSPTKKTEGEGDIEEVRKTSVETQDQTESRELNLEDNSKGVNFSVFIKYIIIAAIIIAIIMMIFSQVMDYQSKDS